jgi:lipopolysaccharide transport system ATP-binding protein
LAFAVGAFLDPEILVVDEVLSVGDAEFQRRCLGKMGDVAREGRTVLFVSHNMAAVQNLCPNSMLIEEGKKKIIGPTDTVISKYLEQADVVAEGDVSGVSYNRGGDGSVRFVHWSVEDEKYGRGFQVGCNHSCRFHISYHISTSIRQKKFSATITIKDMLGQAILTGSTTYSNTDFFDVKEDGVIICEFPQMPLMPGTYKVHLWCSVNGETADVIRDAGSLTIVPSDFYGTGKLPNKNHGFFVVENHWQLEKS